MESSMQESPTVSLPTSGNWIFTSMHRLLLSTWPRRHVRGSEQPIPYPPASFSYTMLICLNDLFACLGLAQTRKLLTNFSKNSFYLPPEPLRRGEFLTNYWVYCYSKKGKFSYYRVSFCVIITLYCIKQYVFCAVHFVN